MSYPRYVSHKEVSAVQIAAVEKASDGGVLLTLEGGFPPVRFSHEEMQRKPHPELGWYLVRYDDNYFSFSPAKAFEEGYALLAPSYTEFNDTGFAGEDDPYGIGEYTRQSAAVETEPVTQNPDAETHEQ